MPLFCPSNMKSALLLSFCLLAISNLLGQNQTTTPSEQSAIESGTSVELDSNEKSGLRNPKKAAIMSALVPGLGQIYNRKYWKLPIVYGAVGTSVYLIGFNRSQYKLFKQYYLWDIDPDTPLKSPYYPDVQPQSLRQQADQYRSWMEFSYIALTVAYLLQIVDASVDAHLSGFDVSEDLSINIRPSIQVAHNFKPVNSLSLSLNF